MGFGFALLAAMIGDVPPTIVVVVGAGGSVEYRQRFGEWAEQWEAAAGAIGAHCQVLGAGESAVEPSIKETFRKTLEGLAGEGPDLWIVLVGHGSHDGREAKFNLAGPDVSAAELAQWLAPTRRRVVAACLFSASGAFVPALASPGRIVIAATKNGEERNFSRFGGFFTRALLDPGADLDKDRQTSLLEAFLAGSRETSAYYGERGRLATEHAVLDDNGDGVGAGADAFHGALPAPSPTDQPPDGVVARDVLFLESPTERFLDPALRRRRSELEAMLASLRAEKDQQLPDDYYRLIEPVILELAEIQERIEE